MTRFRAQVQGGDPAVRRILAPGAPDAVLFDLSGPRGLRRVIGLTDSVYIQQVSWSSGPRSAGSDFRLTHGLLKEPNGSQHGFQMCWHIDRGRALVDEIIPAVGAYWPRLSDAPHLRLRTPVGLFGVLDEASNWATASVSGCDQVTDLLMNTTLRHRGLPLTARCVTSWRRIADPGEVRRAHGARVLAASLDRMIGYRAGNSRAQYAEVAADHSVGVAEMKTASAVLQPRLPLSDTRPVVISW